MVRRLGGTDSEISTLAQFILIPETATTLNLYIFLASYEGSESCEKDFAFVRLGPHLLKTYPLCQATDRRLELRANRYLRFSGAKPQPVFSSGERRLGVEQLFS